MESLKMQEGGLLRAIKANSLAMLKLVESDLTCSEETKEVVSQLHLQQEELLNYIGMSEDEKKITQLRPTGSS